MRQITFQDKSMQKIQEITFEIGTLGRYGLDINDPKEILPGGGGEYGEANRPLLSLSYLGAGFGRDLYHKLRGRYASRFPLSAKKDGFDGMGGSG